MSGTAKNQAPRAAALAREITALLVGSNEMLEALNHLPGVTDGRYRVAATMLCRTRPPDRLTAWPALETIAAEARCSVRAVQECRQWLVSCGAALLPKNHGGRGKKRDDTIDFSPLAERIRLQKGAGTCMVSGDAATNTQTNNHAGTNTECANTECAPSLTPYRGRKDKPLKKRGEQPRRTDGRSWHELKRIYADLVVSLHGAGIGQEKWSDPSYVHRTGGQARRLSLKQCQVCWRQLCEDGFTMPTANSVEQYMDELVGRDAQQKEAVG